MGCWPWAMGEDPCRAPSELAKLGARVIIQRAVEDEFDACLGRARYERRLQAPRASPTAIACVGCRPRRASLMWRSHKWEMVEPDEDRASRHRRSAGRHALFLVYAVINAVASDEGARVGVAIGYIAGAIALSVGAVALWRR